MLMKVTSSLNSCICNSSTCNWQLLCINYRRKYHFGPYILGLQSIWSQHFYSSQFGPCYFWLV